MIVPGGWADRTMKRVLAAVAALIFAPAEAKQIANPIAVFSGLDKITGATTTFEINIGQEKPFGGLIVKPDVCYTREITEEPQTTSFVEVTEVELDNSRKKIFSGWMFAESPALNAVEHPVYDVWLTGCRDPNAPPVPVEEAPVVPAPQNEEDQPPED
jgi:hypothetical protein